MTSADVETTDARMRTVDDANGKLLYWLTSDNSL